jgi:hypothetical protein
VFSAALVGCESKQEAPAPAPAPQQQGSDDLENLLDDDHHVADRPVTDAAVATDATELAAGAIDAGVSADAGVDEKALAAKRAKDAKIAKEKERLRREREKKLLETALPDRDLHNIPKPDGAPPARRRAV